MNRNYNWVALLALTLALSSCSKGTSEAPSAPSVPQVSGPAVDPSRVPPSVRLSNGAELELQKFGGSVFFPVEAVFTEDSFSRLMATAGPDEAERRSAMLESIARIEKKLLKIRGINLQSVPEIGYFTFFLPYQTELMGSLKALEFDHRILMNPVTVDRQSLKNIRALNPLAEGLAPRPQGPRDGRSGFSGLERIRAPQFVALAEAEIGAGTRVNGDSVLLGISDTGITLNHPAYLSADGKRSRVVYMKDFTREGRVYFNLKAAFEATQSTDDDAILIKTAQVIVTPRLPSLPAADEFANLKDLRLKVSPELKAILLDRSKGVKLGVLSEDSLQTEGDPVDLNANGKLDDQFLAFLVPGATPAQDVLYFDATGTGDFRNAKPLSDWNTSRESINVFAEKIGFSMLADKLPTADGKSQAEVRSVSLVGFDPGNHGSHVAGIAAGRKIIANDSDDTLARGVAPASAILMNRVCANNGGCNATQAIIDLALRGNADVINMSLGGLSPFNDGYGVQETVINRLTSIKNVGFVIAAGNSGPGRQTVGSPSTAKYSLSVGASASIGMIQRQYQWPASKPVRSPDEDEDLVFFFSSRGPTAAGGFKPNLVAPGTELSSVRLNSSPSSRAGLDIYWGTSMAAPTATGAYALLLDAIRKFNAKHPDRPLPSDALTLRQVLIDSARPFDVTRFDPVTGQKLSGHYSWTDEGTGMLDLVSAWQLLKQLRDEKPASAVTLADGREVDLEYDIVVPMRNPQGGSYDGTRPDPNEPVFGKGLYLNAHDTETLRTVYIQRKLPELLASGPEAGPLTAQLLTTADEFVLKTVIYGSHKAWLKAGVLDQLDCAGADVANVTVIGRGATIHAEKDGTGTIDPIMASNLNICLDREMISKELSPGDHGALIGAYRVANGKVSPVASFVVPVYLQVPHKVLSESSSYEIAGSVKSFGLDRNYVRVPEGTTLIRVTLEVPALKKNPKGLPLPGESCSGVELMALMANNTDSPIEGRREARATNCDSKGQPVDVDGKRFVRFARANPNPGIWDLHVFGLYKYVDSRYKLRVDYVTASPSRKKIEGGLAALNGSLIWTVHESSFAVVPHPGVSSLEINRLTAQSAGRVAKDAMVIVESPLGTMRKYPAETRMVTVTTGGSPGNDLDLLVLECDGDASDPGHPSCHQVAGSGGATDEEQATFIPAKGKSYAVVVAGYEVVDAGNFVSEERIRLEMERGSVSVKGQAPVFSIHYAFSEEEIAASKILNHELFKSGKYGVGGALTLRTEEDVVISSVPVAISSK